MNGDGAIVNWQEAFSLQTLISGGNEFPTQLPPNEHIYENNEHNMDACFHLLRHN